jgi:soluble lytic murein transglycosylase-like protein
MINNASSKYGIPGGILSKMFQLESSSGNDLSTSSAGAQGYMQFMPDTAKQYGVDPYDAASSFNGAAHYLSDLYNMFGDWKLAVAAYNAGPGNVQKYGGVPPYDETQNYVQKVFG